MISWGRMVDCGVWGLLVSCPWRSRVYWNWMYYGLGIFGGDAKDIFQSASM